MKTSWCDSSIECPLKIQHRTPEAIFETQPIPEVLAPVKLTINQDLYSVDSKDANRKLLWFQRDDLGLVGTRFSCGAGICGACTVLVDG